MQTPLRVSYCKAKANITYFGSAFYWLSSVILKLIPILQINAVTLNVLYIYIANWQQEHIGIAV